MWWWRLPQQVGEAGKGFGSDGRDVVMVDVELFQTGEVPQTEVLQLLNVVLLQVQSHQAAKRGQAHGAHLNRQEETSGIWRKDLISNQTCRSTHCAEPRVNM